MPTVQSTCRTLLLFALLILASRAQAVIIGPLNTPQLMEEAPIACRVQVLSVFPLGIKRPDVSMDGGFNLQDGVATVKVSRVLKGTCPQQITIAVHTREEGGLVTRLHPGEWAIVFLAPLKGKHGPRWVVSPEVRKVTDYFLFSSVNGTLEIPAPVKTAQGVKEGNDSEKDPQMRLLNELVQAAGNKAATQLMLQQSLEQIRIWAAERDCRAERSLPPRTQGTGGPRINAQLRSLRENAMDPTTYALYQITAIRWGVFPTVEDALRVLSSTLSTSERRLRFRPADVRFSFANVQHYFVYSLRVRDRNPKNDTFDDVAFCHKAFQLQSVRQDTDLRKLVAALLLAAQSARSVPDAALLLYDSDPMLRKTGVDLLRAFVGQVPPVPGKETSRLSEEEYLGQEADLLRHWKAWWEAQPKPDKAP